jgi:hypothetical protein
MHIGMSGIHLGQRVDHLRQHDVAGIGARATRRLHDHRRIAGLGRLHDGEPLLHVVDVEGRHAVAVFGGVIEQLAKGDAGHWEAPVRLMVGIAGNRVRAAVVASSRIQTDAVERGSAGTTK